MSILGPIEPDIYSGIRGQQDVPYKPNVRLPPGHVLRPGSQA